VHRTTGLYRDEIENLCGSFHEATINRKATWPVGFGLYKSILVTLIYIRQNRVQEEIAETYDTSQSTISRAISAVTALLAELLRGHVPTADELDPVRQYIVDGTLLPCWSWADHPELYSGKHKTTGMNVQIVCTQEGQLVWISDPIAGSRHDTFCLGQSGVLTEQDPQNWIGDKGYIGNDIITPFRKPADRGLLEWEKEFNTQVNKIRYVIERAIANFKTWRILHTDYRRPLKTFKETISAVVGLTFYLAGE
jgi:hypothetical protein